MKTWKHGIIAVIGIALVAGLFFTACPTDDDKQDNRKLGFIDIVGATQLFVSNGSGGRSINGRSAEDGRVFFKITEDGYVEEVQYFDEEGNEITDYELPTSIYNINDSYVIVCFLTWTNPAVSADGERGYLVRKTDGAVFSLDNVGLPANNPGVAPQDDSMENIYFVIGVDNERGFRWDGITLAKIDTSNPDRLTKVDWIADEGRIYNFIVNPAGHIFYITGPHDSPKSRIKKSNGGLINLSSYFFGSFWIGLDGNNIKYAIGRKIYTVSIDSDFQETITSIDIPFSINSHGTTIRFDDKVIIISGNEVYEVENPANTPRQYTIGEITVRGIANSNDYFYFSGTNSSSQPVLLRLDPKTETVTTLLQPNQYDISQLTVDNDNVVTFSALRMSDGKKVMGQVSVDGEVSMLDVAPDSEITILVRIQ